MVRIRDGLEPAFSIMAGREPLLPRNLIHPDIADASSYERRMLSAGWHQI